MRDEGVICISSIDWDSKWQGHQEIVTALLQAGNETLFVENTGVRAAAIRDLPRLRRRFTNWRRGSPAKLEGLDIYSPLLLPLPYSAIAQRINHVILSRACRQWMDRVGRPRPIVFTFLPTPLIGDLLRTLHPALTIYYCVDDLASSSAGASQIRQSEDELLRNADLVFVTAENLRARAAKFRDEVHVFPAGVSISRFDLVRDSSTELPPDIRDLPRPVVGYLGGLNQKTDLTLLADVARRLPQMRFVIVGPIQIDVSSLAACPNIRMLGQRAHGDVPRYLKGMDVGLIPYRVNEYTSHVYPAKLNEYLAMGLPIVATPLPELRRLNEAHGELVAIADNAEAFSAAIVRALDDRAAARVQQRIAVARANRWESHIDAMTTLIDRALTARRT